MASLKKNVLYLFLIQLMNYGIPLLQVPYLTRVLGINNYGIYAYSLSLISICNIITDFGFNVYLPQKLAGRNSSLSLISRLLYSSSIIKFILLFPVTIIYFYLCFTRDIYIVHYDLFFLTYLILFLNAFSVVWYFQGIEKLYLYTRIFIISKIVSLVAIFFLVKNPDDLSKVSAINLFQSTFMFIYSFYFLMKLEKIRIIITRWKYIKCIFKANWGFFVSRIFATIFSSGCAVFLGYFGHAKELAIYSSAEQLYKAGQQIFSPINQALYPYMVRTKNYRVFFKFVLLTVLISILGLLFGVIFGKFIIESFFGSDFIDAYKVLIVLLAALIFNSLSMIFGYPALSPLGLSSKANYSVVNAGVLQVFIYIFIYFSSVQVTAISMALTIIFNELFVFSQRAYQLYIGLNKKHAEINY